jgi:hypothetical protein
MASRGVDRLRLGLAPPATAQATLTFRVSSSHCRCVGWGPGTAKGHQASVVTPSPRPDPVFPGRHSPGSRPAASGEARGFQRIDQHLCVGFLLSSGHHPPASRPPARGGAHDPAVDSCAVWSRRASRTPQAPSPPGVWSKPQPRLPRPQVLNNNPTLFCACCAAFPFALSSPQRARMISRHAIRATHDARRPARARSPALVFTLPVHMAPS